MSNGGGRVAIPASVRKVIQNIKEISGNHGEEEIYYMLKECNMDPNEAAQRLLHQGSFHEVKRRHRKKEIVESAGSRWNPGMQGLGNRGGRGNHASRHITHDAGGVARNFVPLKDNGNSQVPADKVAISTLPTSQDVKNKKAPHLSSSTVISNANLGISSESKSVRHSGQSITVATDVTKLDDQLTSKSAAEANKTNTKNTQVQFMPGSSSASTSKSATPSGGCVSASDPALVPSQDVGLGAVGTIKHDVGLLSENKLISCSSEVGSSTFVQETIRSTTPVVDRDQFSKSSQAIASTDSCPTVSGPLSDYDVESPQNVRAPKGPGTTLVSEVPDEAGSQDATHTTLTLEKKPEESRISDTPLVIIPNHIHVPEVEKMGFIFGSFDANFGLSASYSVCPENEKTAPIPETSEEIVEHVEQISNHNDLAAVEGVNYPVSSQNVSESLLSDVRDVSSMAVPEYSESKQETDLPPGSQQYLSVHAYPNYSFGVMPPMVGSQVAPTEGVKSQTHDLPRLPSFVVQQPFDPISYYAHIYRSGADSDGRTSPFHEPAISTKFSGNVTMVPPQASQSSQEAGNNTNLHTAGTTPLVTQAAGVAPSSIPATQQTLPVFRHPAGMHLPHYPNYIPYGHYFPFFVPPPAIHPLLSNGAFPTPQPQPGSVYPTPPISTNKYSLPQYKPGSNASNSNHMGAPGSHGPYVSIPASFGPSPATTTGHSSSSEDLHTTQLKENNTYISGQQSEGPGVWFAAPGRDISALPAGSFYNLSQAQMGFAATQVSHGNFPGIYHSTQPVTGPVVHPLLQQSQALPGSIDVNGTAPNAYQPSQPSPINWPNNY